MITIRPADGKSLMVKQRLVVLASLCGLLLSCETHQTHVRPSGPIDNRDAFYDGARVGEGDTIVVVGKDKILRSEDDGVSWESVPSLLGPVLRTDVITPLYAVSFRDDTWGAAVGAEGTYLETTDGGVTWTRRSLDNEEQFLAIEFLDSKVGLIVGEFATIFRTDSGGAEWERLQLDFMEELLPDLWNNYGITDPHLFDLAFCSPTEWVIVGEYGVVLSSADAGQTWKIERGGGIFDRHLFTVVCTDDDGAVAAGQGGEMVFKRGASGEWQTAEQVVPFDIYGITALPQGTMVAVGDMGTVLLSRESGRSGSWKRFTPQYTEAGSPGYSWLSGGLLTDDKLILTGKSGVYSIPQAEIVEAKQKDEAPAGPKS